MLGAGNPGSTPGIPTAGSRGSGSGSGAGLGSNGGSLPGTVGSRGPGSIPGIVVAAEIAVWKLIWDVNPEPPLQVASRLLLRATISRPQPYTIPGRRFPRPHPCDTMGFVRRRFFKRPKIKARNLFLTMTPHAVGASRAGGFILFRTGKRGYVPVIAEAKTDESYSSTV